MAKCGRRRCLTQAHAQLLAPTFDKLTKPVEAIASGTICADVTLTRLWSAQPLSWTQQEEQLLGFACV